MSGGKPAPALDKTQASGAYGANATVRGLVQPSGAVEGLGMLALVTETRAGTRWDVLCGFEPAIELRLSEVRNWVDPQAHRAGVRSSTWGGR